MIMSREVDESVGIRISKIINFEVNKQPGGGLS